MTDTTHYPVLDESRDFGTIAGHFEEHDPMPGAVYAQDGFLFRVDGTLIEAALTPKDRIRLEETVKRNAAVEAARAAFKEVAGDIDPEILKKIVSTDALTKPATDDGELDLVGWARGEKVYNYGKVAKAFRDRFSQSPVNKGQALQILAEHGLIPPVAGTPTIPSQQ